MRGNERECWEMGARNGRKLKGVLGNEYGRKWMSVLGNFV
jgi:hypothetical protein